jgi:hypothetical protein
MPTTTYKQPKSVPVENMPDAGYPQTDIGRAGTHTKGRFMSDVGQKKYDTMRGAGAATKGKKFLVDMDI